MAEQGRRQLYDFFLSLSEARGKLCINIGILLIKFFILVYDFQSPLARNKTVHYEVFTIPESISLFSDDYLEN